MEGFQAEMPVPRVMVVPAVTGTTDCCLPSVEQCDGVPHGTRRAGASGFGWRMQQEALNDVAERWQSLTSSEGLEEQMRAWRMARGMRS